MKLRHMEMQTVTPPKVRRRNPPSLRKRIAVYLLFAVALSVVQTYICHFQKSNQAQEQSPPAVSNPQPAFVLGQEMTELSKQAKLMAVKPNLRVGLLAVDPVTGAYASSDARKAFCAASTIKLPVFLALLLAVDEKKVKLDQTLKLNPESVGGGSGYLQWQALGTKVSVKQTAELMMTVSDNTATNMIIDVLGGKQAVNKTLSKCGLSQTRINNLLPDLGGTNKTSPYDLAMLMARVERGELLSKSSKDWMLSVMERCKTKTLLPAALPAGTRVFHKTGDIAGMVGDAGIVQAADGKRFAVAIQVERPWNDRRANILIRDLSKTIFDAMVGTQSLPPSSAFGNVQEHD
jgi:beta-lactamase class A